MKHMAEIAHVGRRMSSAAIVLLAALFVSGCETSSTVSSGPNPVKCVVALNAPPMMEAVGGTGSLSITTQRECAWDASSNVGWISALSPASGQGPADVSFSVSANEGLSARDGIIEVNGTQARVSQRAICRYEVSPLSQNVEASGAVGRIIVTTAAECAWRAVTESEWIELTSSAAGAGSGTVTFAVRLNDGAQRTAAISIAGQRSLITQASSPAPAPPAPAPPAPPAPGPAPPSPPPTPPPPPACKYSIAPTSQNVTVGATTGTVTVTADAGCTWTATSGAPWITVTSGTSGTGNGPVGFSVAANTGSARSGTMTIAGQAFTVNQAACTYSISPETEGVGPNDGAGSVTVSTTSSCQWTAVSNVPWMTIASASSGTGNGTVVYRFLVNPGPRRTGTITIAGRTLTVMQGSILQVTR
jgi:BACON domain-containing protein/all-beta uncharacterized protein